MPSYIKPIAFTVEFSYDNGDQGRSVVWFFTSFQEGQARKLYSALESSEKLEGATPQTLNLVAWDSHPTRDEARGMILEQTGFDR